MVIDNNEKSNMIPEAGKQPPVHPDYERLCREWAFYEGSYIGGSRYRNLRDAAGKPVLVQHQCESKIGYDDRKCLSAYHNYPRAVTDRLCSIITSRPVIRDERVNEWGKDVSKGLSLQRFMNMTMTKAATMGLVGILVDSTLDVAPSTRAQQQGAGISLSYVHPNRVHNWNDERSVVQMIIGQQLVQLDDTFITTWQLTKAGDVASAIADVRPHGWSSNPLVWQRGVGQDDNPGASLIGDISEHSRLLFNYCSWLTEESQKATFTQFILACPNLDQDPAKMLSQVPLGSRNWLVIPVSQNDVKWESIGCDAAQADSLRQSIAMEVAAIYRTVGLQTPESIRSSAESGVALRIRLSEMSASANRLAENAEHAENKVLSLWSTAIGGEVDKSQYPDPDDVDEGSLAEDLAAALDLITASVPVELKGRALADWADRKFDDDELVKKINSFYLAQATTTTPPPPIEPNEDEEEDLDENA